MKPDRLSGRARMAVLALHAAALAAGVAYSWAQWTDVATQSSLLDQSRETVRQLDTRLAGGRIGRPGTPHAADPFISGDAAAVAGANLQDRVVSAIRAAGGTVTSSQVDTTAAATAGSGNGPPSIQLTVSCEVHNTALQGLLYGLESQAPALFLDQITIEGRGAGGVAGSRDALKIDMAISAYWRGVDKS